MAPRSASWTWVLANALVLSATVHLVTALLNPLLAGGSTLVLWFCGAITNNLAPHVWLPLAYYRDQDGRWLAATVLVAVTITVHTGTCGTTAWAHRQFAKER